MLLDYEKAKQLQKSHRCAGCWNELDVLHVRSSQQVNLVCTKCGEAGLVTAWFVNNRRQKDIEEASEARRNLQKAGVLPTISYEKAMRDLGFEPDKFEPKKESE